MNDNDDPQALRAEIARLNKVVTALMDRAEREMSNQRSNFGLFQTTIMLEGQVRSRTLELQAALEAIERKEAEQRVLIDKLKNTRLQLLQAEKMASIGQLAAGVAHEINNPIGFVASNLGTLNRHIDALLAVIAEYEGIEAVLTEQPALRAKIAETRRRHDYDYVRGDIRELIAESIEGTTRVRRIVQELRDFSHVDKADWQQADLHAGLDSTLNVVRNELKHKADVIREYRELPPIECVPSQLNQVFLNVLINAVQAIAEHGTITIRTGHADDEVFVAIADTGAGMPPEVQSRIFEPFYTTKPVGQGTGLGLAVSYGIIEQHGGRIEVASTPGTGTTFTIRLPIRRPPPAQEDIRTYGSPPPA